MYSILDMKIGEKAFILDFNNKTHACKLLTLGLLPKSTVEVLRYSPLGDALYLKIDHQLIAVRKEEAAQIMVDIQK